MTSDHKKLENGRPLQSWGISEYMDQGSLKATENS